MTIDWLAKGKWDQTFLEDILTSLEKHETDRAVVVVPGAEMSEKYDEVNEHISQYNKVLVVVTSDECSLFDSDELEHPNMIVYSQYPTKEKSKNVSLWLPIGYTPHVRKAGKRLGPIEKEIEWMFSGQINNDSRRELVEVLKTRDDGFLLETEGFTQGLDKNDYAELLAKSKVVPSPWGIVVPEAFRTYEALELGAVPIAQGKEYHLNFMADSFIYLDDWEHLPYYIDHCLKQYPWLNNQVQAQWILEKRLIRNTFKHDLGISESDITVLMSTSPVPTNPDTSNIEASIASVRKQLPDSEIIIMVDGVREEQKEREPDYQEFVRRLLWKVNFEMENVIVLINEGHCHQLEVTRRALPYVTTPLVAFVEHDMFLKEKEIPWEKIVETLKSDKLDVLRFYFDDIIEPLHAYLMVDMEPSEVNGIPVVKTGQWSQRPHVAKTDMYEYLLHKYASPDANCMIEDALHGYIADKFLKKGWNNLKIGIYAPEGGYSYAYHVDGRGDESKFEKEQKY